MKEQSVIVKCDFCNKVIKDGSVNKILIEPYPNEGPSTLSCNGKIYEFNESDFCGLECFINFHTEIINDMKDVGK